MKYKFKKRDEGHAFFDKKRPGAKQVNKREDARQLGCLAFIYEKVSFKDKSLLFSMILLYV